MSSERYDHDTPSHGAHSPDGPAPATHALEDATLDPATFWENRYSGPVPSWSGRPNAALEREAANLPPGTALDLGCGEGGDALWLARNGWRVTAVDISPSALALGAATAVSGGVADSIRWLQADLAVWQPEETFDLVTAHFLHSPVELPREVILRRAAAAVAVGGLLLIVGHAGVPPWSKHAHDPAALPASEEVLAMLTLPVADWTVVTSAEVERAATAPDGTQFMLSDSVLSVRRTGVTPAAPATAH
jgi:SAM-dependent methyltransferase